MKDIFNVVLDACREAKSASFAVQEVANDPSFDEKATEVLYGVSAQLDGISHDLFSILDAVYSLTSAKEGA